MNSAAMLEKIPGTLNATGSGVDCEKSLGGRIEQGLATDQLAASTDRKIFNHNKTKT